MGLDCADIAQNVSGPRVATLVSSHRLDAQLAVGAVFVALRIVLRPGTPEAPAEAERQNARDMYAGQVTLVDRWVGRFLEMAERLGLLTDTLILWTTDHGHLFGEHGLRGKSGAELGKLYEITTRIPLLVYHPEGRGAGQRVQGIVQPPDLC